MTRPWTRAALCAGLCALATHPARAADSALPAPAPASGYAAAQTLSAPQSDWPAERWWQRYNDPQLDALIDEALAKAPDIAVARARLAQAAAAAGQTAAEHRPGVTANANLLNQKPSANTLPPSPSGWQHTGDAELDFGWQLDFWGRQRAQLAQAISEREARRAELAEARLTLAAAIANAYAELALQFAEHDAARQSSQLLDEQTALLRQRVAVGMDTPLALFQSENRLAQARAESARIDGEISMRRNQIAALLGAGPDRGLAIDRPQASVLAAYALPAQASLNLLGRRPDLRAARLRVQAQQGLIDQRQAAFYPDISVSALLGLQSVGLNLLARQSSVTASYGPALSLPLFDRDSLRAQLQGARAGYAEAVADYDRCLAQALRELADVGAQIKAHQQILQQDQAASAAASAAVGIVRQRFDQGMDSYLDVLQREQDAVDSRRTLARQQATALKLDIALQQALGGGYTEAAP